MSRRPLDWSEAIRTKTRESVKTTKEKKLPFLQKAIAKAIKEYSNDKET